MEVNEFISNAKSYSLTTPIELPSDICMDGKIHRFNGNSNKLRRKNEWYAAHILDTHFYIIFGSWTDEDVKYYHDSYHKMNLSPEELKRIKKLREEADEKTKREKEELYALGAKEAKRIWEEAKPCESHPYLTKKKVSSYGLREYEGALIIPMYSAETGELQSLQKIYPDGSKPFLPNGRATRSFFMLGEGKEPFIAEGYATGATVHELTGKPVVIAFSAGWCAGTALHLKKRHLIDSANLLQDLDEAGEKVAEQWKEFRLGEVFKPDFADKEPLSDWNDLFNIHGAEFTKNQLKDSQYPTFSIQDILTMPIKEESWAIENLFIEGSYNVVYAMPGVGKSLLSTDISIGVSAGIEIMNGWKCRRQKVLVVDGELTMSTFKKRWVMALSRWNEYIGDKGYESIEVYPGNYLKSTVKVPFNLYCSVSRRMLNPLIERNDFILLDNFDCLTRRTSVEDSHRSDEAEWSLFFDWIDSWKAKGKTFCIVMHCIKSGTIAGTRRITGDADTIIRLDPMIHEVKTKPDRHGFIVSITKGRQIEPQYQKAFGLEMLSSKEALFGIPWIEHSCGKMLDKFAAIKKEQKENDITKLIRNIY